jgi:hypothetical protein
MLGRIKVCCGFANEREKALFCSSISYKKQILSDETKDLPVCGRFVPD